MRHTPVPAAAKRRQVFTPALGRRVWLRDGTSDEQVWGDTFTGLYHVPPESVPTPQTVLDLGANIGLTAAHYRLLWPQAEVVAVEMDAENAEMAAVNARDVRVRVEAVVADAGGVQFYDDSGRSTDSYAIGTGTRMVQGLPLRKIILRSFADIEARGGVGFVKMDIEGMEWALFERPEWAPLVRHLLVELHGDPGADAASLVAFGIARLVDAGFRAVKHEPHPQAVYAWRD